MTEREKQQQKEIERLQKKIKALSEAYSSSVQELNALKNEKSAKKHRGRPGINSKTSARIVFLYQQGKTMRQVAEETNTALSTVHKVIAEVSKESRMVYIYMDRETPSTIIDVCGATGKVKILNLTDDMISRAFGIKEKPDWEDFEEFLESRCMPRTRYGIREELEDMGIDTYDVFRITEQTSGRVYGDAQWLKRMNCNWMQKYDALMKEMRGIDKTEQRRKILEFVSQDSQENRIW